MLAGQASATVVLDQSDVPETGLLHATMTASDDVDVYSGLGQSFQVTRERDGNKIVIKYSGKISGDTITGKSENGDRSRDWKAERAK